jgi:SAM-dependent methyltransferase
MSASETTVSVSSVLSRHADLVVCPACRGDLQTTARGFRCAACGHEFAHEEQIPRLFWPHEQGDPRALVTDNIKSFYEENPFPDYDDLDTSWSLREKAREGIFARLLDEQIPPGARVVEIGCGTGQLSNFLGLTAGRTVFGTDICLNSLRLGQAFKERNRIDNATFLQMNLFRPVFRPESFDLVISNGVLLVTSDPFAGFQSIGRLVKPGGFILIGLYNTYGRLLTDVRRFIFHMSGDRFQFLDPQLRDPRVGRAKKHAWFMDQYKNPHETKQTFGEVLGWFERSGFEFVNSIPKCQPLKSLSPDERLFESAPSGNRLDRFLTQAAMLLSGSREGGFFVMIGRKKSEGIGQASC